MTILPITTAPSAAAWCLAAAAVLGIALCADGDAAPAGEPPDVLKTFVDELVPITPGEGRYPGSFRMGTEDGPARERPAREVTFEYRFAIAKYEVPQDLYLAVTGRNPSRWKGPRNSVEMVTWNEANEFCRRLTEMLRAAGLIADDEMIRLPTEAEWEYCCRAGTTTAYSFGDAAQVAGDTGSQARVLDEYAWHAGNAAGNDPPVGALKPNPWGLYDMHGYLWEFCLDDWYEDHAGAPGDGSARQGVERGRIVIRGGSWKDEYPDLRSASRRPFGTDRGLDSIGFRCVKANVR